MRYGFTDQQIQVSLRRLGSGSALKVTVAMSSPVQRSKQEDQYDLNHVAALVNRQPASLKQQPRKRPITAGTGSIRAARSDPGSALRSTLAEAVIFLDSIADMNEMRSPPLKSFVDVQCAKGKVSTFLEMALSPRPSRPARHAGTSRRWV